MKVKRARGGQPELDDELDLVFQALADRSRRRILDRLAKEGVLTPGELGRGLSISKSSVSKHLGVLERAGLIRRLAWGRFRSCQLQTKALLVAQRWIGWTAADHVRRRRLAPVLPRQTAS